MPLTLTPDQRADLEDAAARARQTRSWKRYRALLLLADGQTIAQVSTALACGQSTVYRWVAIWREQGLACLAEGPHPGRTRRLDPTAEARLQALLGSDPQAHGHLSTGWTAPLLLGALAAGGWVVHEHTLRRTLKRLGYRWKRPQYVLGRPDPAYAEKRGP
jgi:transposase